MAERYPISVDVPRDGITLTAIDQFKVIIPANAVSSVVTLEIVGPTFRPSYLSSIQPASFIYILSPQGFELAKEAEIYIPFYKTFDEVADYLRIYYRPDVGGTVDPWTWEPLPVVDSGIEGIAAAKFTKFGAFFVGYEP